MWHRGLQFILLVIINLSITGCLFDTVKPDDPRYAPVPPEMLEPPKPKHGSLFQAGYGLSLYDDMKARHVGDILTVTLTESTDSEKSTDMTVEKNSTISMPNPTILGSTPQFNTPGLLPLLSNRDNTLNVSANHDRNYSGKGERKQKNKLSGTITVSVAKVLPNGNLVIRGEKWYTLSHGEEYIRLTGIVRPQDVGSDNVVLSTRIANARIQYSGTDEVADASKIGWLAKFFVSTFWPL